MVQNCEGGETAALGEDGQSKEIQTKVYIYIYII